MGRINSEKFYCTKRIKIHLHYRNKPDSGIQHSHLCNQYDKDNLKFEIIFISNNFWVIYNHTYDPNTLRLLDYTPLGILMSCKYLHILSILFRTSRYRQDSSHSPLIKITNCRTGYWVSFIILDRLMYENRDLRTAGVNQKRWWCSSQSKNHPYYNRRFHSLFKWCIKSKFDF